MKKANIIVSILCVGFLLSCATGHRLQKEPGKVTGQSESSEKDDALSKRLKTLEESVSVLRSEVANIGYRLDSGQTRRSLTAYKLPKEVSLCEERFPLEDRNVWENMDREFLVALFNEAQVGSIQQVDLCFIHVNRSRPQNGS